MVCRMVHFAADESGAAAAEYSLLVVAIAAVIILTVFYFGGYVEGEFSTTCIAFSAAGTASNTSTVGGC